MFQKNTAIIKNLIAFFVAHFPPQLDLETMLIKKVWGCFIKPECSDFKQKKPFFSHFPPKKLHNNYEHSLREPQQWMTWLTHTEPENGSLQKFALVQFYSFSKQYE